jgi:very-short-patch-repair endonuclease
MRWAIIKVSKGAKDLREVKARAEEMLEKAKRDFQKQLFEKLITYLEIVVPELERWHFTDKLELSEGINVMDLSGMRTETQHLVIASTIEYAFANLDHVVVIVPEAWETLPQTKMTPVKWVAQQFIRKGAAIGNYLWLDSQDIGGIDKTPLRQCDNWLMGRMKEAHEVERILKQLLGMKVPAEEIQTLPLGHFYAVCFGPRTPITTEHGVVKIKDIKIGDKVLTNDGTYHKVVNVTCRQYVGPIIEIRPHRASRANYGIWPTPEHPILTDKGWKKAEELTLDDKIKVLAKPCLECGKPTPFFQTYCSRRCARRAQDKNPVIIEKRRQNSRKLFAEKFRDPKFREKTLRSYLSKRGMSAMEFWLDQLFQRRWPYLKYVGDGKIIIDGHCPDWINEQKRIIVELFNEWHHDPLDEEKKITFYNQRGYKCIIVWVHEMEHNPQKLVERLERELPPANQAMFTFIPIKRIIRKQRSIPSKVYNLVVEGNPTYLTNGIVVHNCGNDVRKVYVLPVGVPEDVGVEVARGIRSPESVRDGFLKPKIVEGDDLMYKEKWLEEKRKREELEKQFSEFKAVFEKVDVEELKQEILKLRGQVETGKEAIEKLKDEKATLEAELKKLEPLKAFGEALAKFLAECSNVRVAPGFEPSQVDLEHRQLVVNVHHAGDKVVKVSTDSVVGQILFAAVKYFQSKEFSTGELNEKLLEHGWNVKPSTLSAKLSLLANEGKLIKTDKGYRLPSRIKFEV